MIASASNLRQPIGASEKIEVAGPGSRRLEFKVLRKFDWLLSVWGKHLQTSRSRSVRATYRAEEILAFVIVPLLFTLIPRTQLLT